MKKFLISAVALCVVVVVAVARFGASHDRVRGVAPVRGHVIVTNSPRDANGNGHQDLAEQEQAWDLVPLDADRDMHARDGSRLEDWPGFGRSVRAPVSGTVAAAVDRFDNRPPREPLDSPDRAKESPAGNHVLIETADHTYVLVAHLDEGSVSVSVGDRVERGQPIGRVGNSGRSSGPHVHLHAQDRRELYAARGAAAVPFEFTGCRRIGRFEYHGDDEGFHTWHRADVARPVKSPRRGDVL